MVKTSINSGSLLPVTTVTLLAVGFGNTINSGRMSAACSTDNLSYAALTARRASALPYPQLLLILSLARSGPVLSSLRTVVKRISRIWSTVRLGLACSISATMPVTAGDDIDVPLIVLHI